MTENSYYEGVAKCDRHLLQSVSGIKKCYILLYQRMPGIIKCKRNYKKRRNRSELHRKKRRYFQPEQWYISQKNSEKIFTLTKEMSP